MQMVIECECGWSLQGPEDALIEATRQHDREAHGMELTREQVLAAAKPSEAG
jgi:predicted small metal-binding protein